MDPQRWRQVRSHFEELIELDDGECKARLAALAAADLALHDAVARLLGADGEADEWLEALESTLLPPPHDAAAGLPDPLALTGRMLAHFRVIEPLGAGGMGVVYRAIDTRLERTVALKVPLTDFRLDPSGRLRFLREARSVAVLDHPNLCGIHEVGETGEGQPFLAMPLYEGETLKARLARQNPLSVAEAVEIARQVAEGLASAHDAGVVHRDVKPGNVMLLPSGSVKILDFGLAKVRDVSLTGSRAQLGTVSYMAPEQIRGGKVDGRADLWALGVLLYEMLTGRRPFEGERDVSIAHAIVHEEPLRPTTLRRDIPRALEDLLVVLLRKDPARRLASARDVVGELAALRSGHVLPIRRSLRQRWASATGWRRRRLRPATVVVVSAVFALATGTMLATRLPNGRAAVAQLAATDGSIAVLPFANLSGDVQQEYLSAGISEELTTQLTRIEGLRVLGGTSTSGFRGRSADPRAVGRALGVAAVLHGGVRRDGDRIRIDAQLTDASNGHRLWSDTYDRKLNDIFAVEDDISRAIVAALQVRLPARTAGRLPPTGSAEAYELYLKGRYFWNQRTEDALVRAADYFQRAVALDPGYAAAHAGLADVEIAPRAGRPAERFARARIAAARALALDSLLPEAHVSMSWISMWYDRDWVAAERHIRRALELNPGSIWTVSRYGAYLAATGQVDESLRLLRRAHELDPLSYVHATYVGTHLLWLRRDDEAIVFFRKALELNPDYFMAHWGLARAYLRQGRYEQALAELAYEGGEYTGLTRAGLLGSAHAVAGNEREARRLLRGLHEQARRGEYVPPVNVAIIHIALGEQAEALDWLERVEADLGARIFLGDPIFDPVRLEPRFQQLRQRLRLQ